MVCCYIVIFCEFHCVLIVASWELWSFIAQNSQPCNYPHDDSHFFRMINVLFLSYSRFFFIKSTLPFAFYKFFLLWFPYRLFAFFPFFFLLLFGLFLLCLIPLNLTFMSEKQRIINYYYYFYITLSFFFLLHFS